MNICIGKANTNMKKLVLPKFGEKEKNHIIPVFFACDDNYVKYMMVTMKSLIRHASLENEYRFYVLHTNISREKKNLVRTLEMDHIYIDFCDVSEELAKVKQKLKVRDYYSLTTYYRIFIAEMFPEYDKVLYIDSDTVLYQDIAKLYNYQMGKNYIGAVQDYLVVSDKLYGDYVEKVLGVSRAAYFNAGVVLINCEMFRKEQIKSKFVELLNTYSFVVAQDQDYLNILCQDHILWLDSKWNVQMTETKIREAGDIGLVHYNLAKKPWHDKDCKYGDAFWKYAKLTPFYEELKAEQENFGEEDAKKILKAGENLMHLAQSEIVNENNYFNLFVEGQDITKPRQEIIAMREQYEKEGRFDEDLEDDPPSRMLMPDEVDYLRRNMTNRLRTRYAFKFARFFMNTMIKKNQIVIKEVKGVEYFKSLSTGAIITLNHFNAFDSFAAQIAYEKAIHRGVPLRRKLFRVIKEGNYTSFPGFYGFLMRNCNTLPLSSNKDTMRKFMRAVDKILQKGHLILIYPEQSLWWNYRKPKPLKKGAYNFAAKNNVPVLPIFITMEDTNIPGEGGLPVQAYTINIAPPIYPDSNKNKVQNTEEMMRKNAKVWKEIYEREYKIPLEYTCDDSFVEMYK